MTESRRNSIDWGKELSPELNPPEPALTKADQLTRAQRAHLAEHAPMYLAILGRTLADEKDESNS